MSTKTSRYDEILDLVNRRLKEAGSPAQVNLQRVGSRCSLYARDDEGSHVGILYAGGQRDLLIVFQAMIDTLDLLTLNEAGDLQGLGDRLRRRDW